MYIEEWILEKLLREEWERSKGYLYMPYVEVPFYRVKSESFAIADMELKAYELPISKIIEDNSVKDIARLENQQLFEEFEKLFLEEKY